MAEETICENFFKETDCRRQQTNTDMLQSPRNEGLFVLSNTGEADSFHTKYCNIQYHMLLLTYDTY